MNGPSVVCRMLKLSWFGSYNSGYQNGFGPIQLDEIKCNGNEMDIDQCSHAKWGVHNCGHQEDVGVSCKNDINFVRLRGGSKIWEGFYEIYNPGIHEWFGLCSDGFDNNEAKVICRSMNFSPDQAVVIQRNTNDLLSLNLINEQFDCSGYEEELFKCNTVKKTICNSANAAMISCGENLDIRLVHGNTSNDGKVEIKHNGRWGDICDTGINQNDATVLCRMLGYGYIRTAVTFRYNGTSNVNTLLENLDCSGDELDINKCSNIQWGSACRGGSLGLKCYMTNIRLIGGPSPFEGRLEVFYNGSWGTVCDDDFDNKDGAVVCRMLGAKTNTISVTDSAHYGQGSGMILMDDINCSGTEIDIAQCYFRGWGIHNCGHSEDVSVKCDTVFDFRLVNNNFNRWEGRLEINMNGTWGTTSHVFFTPDMADEFCRYLGYNESERIYSSIQFGAGSSYLPILPLQHLFGNRFPQENTHKFHEDDVGISCRKTNIRLVGGTAAGSGRVEIQYKGLWGAICCDGATSTSATVICKQLGYKGSSYLSSYSAYGVTHGQPMWIKNLRCNGNENDVSRCPSDPWASDSCAENCNIGVICDTTPVRLINGSAPFQGRVEFQHDSVWGTIYSTNSEGAKTVCRMLGYNESDTTNIITDSSFAFGNGTEGILPSINCAAYEMDIEGCLKDSNANWTRNSYSGQNVMVRCLLQIRLVGGPANSIGRVEIQRNNIWGTLCGVGMTDNLATEICKMLAPTAHTWHITGRLIKNTFYGKSTGPIWRIQDGCTSDIAKCLLPSSAHSDCNHSNDVGVFCNSNLNVRLTGGSHVGEGRVEMYYNNEWVGLCDSSWDVEDASAVCRSIGFWKTSPTVRLDAWFGLTTNQLWYLNPNCPTTNEVDLGLCSASYYYGYSHCSQSDEAGVTCISTNLGREHIRLVNGDGSWKGELLIETSNNQWGAVCSQFWNTQFNQVVCSTLQYRVAGRSYSSYIITNNTEPLYLSSFNCSGHETDLGMCKGYFDVYKCSSEAIGIDCSGGMQVKLENGSNPFEGRVEINLSGAWKTICDGSWDSYDAKAVCSSLGISGANPIVLSNAYFGRGNTSNSVRDIGCAGWEDHIGQCNIQESGSCSHSDDSGVKCIECYEEYDTDSGHIVSKNYPSYDYNQQDCIYVIKPTSSSTNYLLQFEGLSNIYDRVIEVREGYQGKQLFYMTTYFNAHDLVIGKEFFIRYRKRTTAGVLFKITWRPLKISDAINVGCESNSWGIVVNMTILKSLYPDSISELIFFPDSNCKGIWNEDAVLFRQTYAECNTQRQDNANSISYKNKLMYPDSNTPNPVVIRHYRWSVDVDCEIAKVNSGNVNIHPDENYATTPKTNNGHTPVIDHISGSGKEMITIHFYKDSHFLQEISGNPLNIHIGENVYVKVTSDADSNYKMRLHSCVAKPTSWASDQQSYPLIKDGCTTDSTTQIISQERVETKFLFNVFEFPGNKDNVYIECNATFCLSYESSAECNQVCHTKRSTTLLHSSSFIKTGKSPLFAIYERIGQHNVFAKTRNGMNRSYAKEERGIAAFD